jgi:hypothetical protein
MSPDTNLTNHPLQAMTKKIIHNDLYDAHGELIHPSLELTAWQQALWTSFRYCTSWLRRHAFARCWYGTGRKCGFNAEQQIISILRKVCKHLHELFCEFCYNSDGSHVVKRD